MNIPSNHTDQIMFVISLLRLQKLSSGDFLYQMQLTFSELMHLIWFIMIVISTSAPTSAAAAVLLPVTGLYGVIRVSVLRWVYGTQRCRLHYG